MLPSAYSDCLGLCDVKDFVAQYTPRQFAVIRFVAPVAGNNATTRYQAGATRYLGRTSTGWNRAGSLTLPLPLFRATSSP
jgi:hypothetical protein